MSVIAFLTDFGQRDWYLAAMKAVALHTAPNIPMVDISHDTPAGNISHAAFILNQCWLEFPVGAVFCVVVDPGVGTDRAPVAVEAEGRFFVGPDNGLFGWLGNRVKRCHRIANAELYRAMLTHTFHGRDLFAPVAASLAAGEVTIEQVGPVQDNLVQAPWPEPEYDARTAYGKILYVDHYGNCITNLPRDDLINRFNLEHAIVSLHPRRIPLLRTFGEAPRGQPLAYFGSGNLLEIAVNGGHAARQLELRENQRVELHVK